MSTPAEEVIRAAAQVLMDAVLRALDDDQHEFGSRGCATCRFVSQMAGWDFGCVRRYKRAQLRARETVEGGKR